jgi:hypothetical protein
MATGTSRFGIFGLEHIAWMNMYARYFLFYKLSSKVGNILSFGTVYYSIMYPQITNRGQVKDVKANA